MLEQVAEGWSSCVLNTSKDEDFTAALGPCSVFYEAHWNIFPLARFVSWSEPHHLALPLFSQLLSGNNITIIFLKVVRDLLISIAIVIHFYLQDSSLSLRTATILNVSMQKLTVFFLEVEGRRINHIPRSSSEISAVCSCCLQKWDISLDVRDFVPVTWSQKLNHSLSWDGRFLPWT